MHGTNSLGIVHRGLHHKNHTLGALCTHNNCPLLLVTFVIGYHVPYSPFCTVYCVTRSLTAEYSLNLVGAMFLFIVCA